MSTSATPAIEHLVRAGVPHEILAYELPERRGRARHERPDYGREAAAALGIEPERMGKTLIAIVDGGLVAVIVPVARTLDLKALATAVGGRRATLAGAADAERATGAVIGGISPLGMRRQIPVVLDAALAEAGSILVSAGRRGLQLELAATDLVAAVDATVAPIARSG